MLRNSASTDALQIAMIPKYSLMGPFRGHMSIKSSPFSPSSACKLSSQYIIQDHMAVHYRKLLSAKAAVDSSVPRSLNTSIKYRDQQKREKLIKAVEKFKKAMMQNLSTPQYNFRNMSTENHKWLQDSLNLPSRGGMSTLKKREHWPPKYFKMTLSGPQSPVLNAEETIQDIVQRSLSQASNNDKNTVKQHGPHVCWAHPSLVSHSRKKIFQIPQKTALSGDLLDTHAQCFTETKQPFTPKVLKTSSKSFVSKYRYYNQPAKKKSISVVPQQHKRPTKICRSLEDESLRSYADYHTQHLVKKQPQKSASLQSLLCAKEEERKYLQLLQEVTEDILVKNCYHKKVLDDIFQKHYRVRRCDLNEVKMQRIFQALKQDLNICTHLPDPSVRIFTF
ncbi:spermatogenesis-associated protein 7 homolog [Sceloporus undulatus]|uniref:spermatogenesis-associated protein 7 homolog n=1 Tax=Sceloporus undulatus TaxID=8520 RepID=UPI001C4BD95A|nr:spermatogenesis-associated protein 7 homolog [Sceloporus undulatus]